MKNIKNGLPALFVLTGILLFTACGSPVEVIEELPLPLTEADFNVTTLEPEINEFHTTLKGKFTVNEAKVDQELSWGFMWRRDGEPLSAMKRISVGKGYKGTSFFIHTDDFPRGEKILVCSFVEFKTSEQTEAAEVFGEEVFFDL